MTTHYAPTDHVGHYVFPEGCTEAWVWDCHALTSIEFPKGCTQAEVKGCPAITSVSFPEGCTKAEVWNCPAITSIEFPKGCVLKLHNCPQISAITQKH